MSIRITSLDMAACSDFEQCLPSASLQPRLARNCASCGQRTDGIRRAPNAIDDMAMRRYRIHIAAYRDTASGYVENDSNFAEALDRSV